MDLHFRMNKTSDTLGQLSFVRSPRGRLTRPAQPTGRMPQHLQVQLWLEVILVLILKGLQYNTGILKIRLKIPVYPFFLFDCIDILGKIYAIK